MTCRKRCVDCMALAKDYKTFGTSGKEYLEDYYCMALEQPIEKVARYNSCTMYESREKFFRIA